MKFATAAMGILFAMSTDAATITGTILDKESGEGFPGTEVEIFLYRSAGTDLGSYKRTAVTDQDGQFSFHLEIEGPLCGHIEIRDKRNVYSHQKGADEVHWDGNRQTSDILFIREPTRFITGRVVAATGAPVAGAHISAIAEIEGEFHYNSIQADEDGNFGLPLPFGTHMLIVHDYAMEKFMLDPGTTFSNWYSDTIALEVSRDAQPDEIVLVAHPALTIEGTLTDTRGIPLPDIKVRFDAERGTNWISSSAVTKGDGSFKMYVPALSPLDGSIKIGETFTDEVTIIKKVSISNDLPVKLELAAPSGGISGRVQIPDHHAPRYSLQVRKASSSMLDYDALIFSTNSTYALKWLADGDYVLSFRMDDANYNHSFQRRVTISNGDHVTGVDFLPGEISICGFIVVPASHTNTMPDSLGGGIGKVTITHLSGGTYSGWSAHAFISAKGEFCVSNLFAGKVNFQVVIMGRIHEQIISVEESISDLSIHFAGEASLSGRVFDAQGFSISNATIIARRTNETSDTHIFAHSDEHGYFRIEHIPRGSYQVATTSRRGIALPVVVELHEQVVGEIQLTIPHATGCIEVHVDEILPGMGSFVSLRTGDGLLLDPGVFSQEIPIRITNLPDGKYQVGTTMPKAEISMPVVIIGGATSRVDFTVADPR